MTLAHTPRPRAADLARRRSRPTALALACAAALCGPAAWAQAPAGASPARVPTLDTVTVIGTGLPTEVLYNPASITVIPAEEIAAKAPVSVAALLRDVPGVRLSEEGIERISIRGEPARSVAILIDGQKLTDHTSYGQPVLVDPTTIERIEVVRGAASVVAGSSAIGGVINIITKKGAAKPLELTASAGYLSATRGHRATVSAAGTLPAGAGKLDYRLSLGAMKQDDRATPNGRLQPSDVKDQSLTGHLGYRTGSHYFGVNAQAYDLAANVYVGMPDFSIALPHRDLRKVSVFYEGERLTPWLTKLSINAFHQTVDRAFRNDVAVQAGPMRLRVRSDSTDQQATDGANLRAEMRLSPDSRTVAGLEWLGDGLQADKASTTTRTPPGSTSTSHRFDDASQRTVSAFAQHELALGDRLTAIVGARASRVQSRHRAATVDGTAQPTADGSEGVLLGSAGLVWSADEHLALRANVSQGYISPTLGQLFLTTTAGGTTLVGNPNLKAEHATTYELGARYAAQGTVLDAALFHTRSRDYIAQVNARPFGTYQNVDAARSWGVELYAEHALGAWGLTPYTALTLMRRELRYGNGFHTRDGGSPTWGGKLGVRKDWQAGAASGSIDLYARGESRIRLRDETGVQTAGSAGYATLGLSANVDLGKGLKLVAELNNLTNRRYTPYGQMPGAERSINVFVTQTF